MSEHFYEQIADWYDLEFDDFDADVELYLGYGAIVGSPVLELGCGTGRLLVPLARAGLEVVGLDASTAMVERARQRLERDGIGGVELVVGDMRDLSRFSEGRFRLIFSAINSFLHMETREDQLKALRAIRRVLDHDGILVLDVFQPTPAALQAMDDRFALDGHWQLPGGDRLDRFSQRRVHPAEQRIDTILLFDRADSDGRVRRTVARYRMRYIHRFEMESLLAEAGFEMEGTYGSYGLDPLEDSSASMIFVAHRR